VIHHYGSDGLCAFWISRHVAITVIGVFKDSFVRSDRSSLLVKVIKRVNEFYYGLLEDHFVCYCPSIMRVNELQLFSRITLPFIISKFYN